MEKLTLGSLFSGSGGFELGAMLEGITPVWASEIEPFPIRVTTKRMPQVKHYGDVSKIRGGSVEVVDIISFGSPCTQMSIAGKREGLNGKQSGLFHEAIRIIKEMREITNGQYPKYAVFENVVGCYSSSKGEDFRQILEEIAKIKAETTSIPVPEKGKWKHSGEIVGDDFSIAWRTLDSQFWGVPQRRRRCYLVADFNGECAGKILFESEGMSRYSPQSIESWQGITSNSENSIGETGKPIVFEQGANSKVGCHVRDDVTGTLRAKMGDNQIAVAIENHPSDSRIKIDERGTVQTLTSRMGTGGGNVPLVGIYDVRFTSEGTVNSRGNVYETNTSRTIDTGGNFPDSNQGGIAVVSCSLGRSSDMPTKEELAPSLVARGVHSVATYSSSGASFFCNANEELADTLMATDYKDPPLINDVNEESNYIVRRLTPTECARLQGFPDWWCDDLGIEEPTEEDILYWSEVFETHKNALGKTTKPKTRNQIIKWLKSPHSDSAEYKMWGNGVALPCVRHVMAGIVWVTEENKGR